MATSPTSGPGGAGGVTPVGAYVYLAADLVAFAGGTVLFDTVAFDSAGYFDAANHRFVIPAGRTGLHLVGFQANAEGGVGTTAVNCTINNGGAQANVQSGLAKDTVAGGVWAATPSLLVHGVAGDTLDCSLSFEGVATMTVAGGTNGSVFWIVYLG